MKNDKIVARTINNDRIEIELKLMGDTKMSLDTLFSYLGHSPASVGGDLAKKTGMRWHNEWFLPGANGVLVPMSKILYFAVVK